MALKRAVYKVLCARINSEIFYFFALVFLATGFLAAFLGEDFGFGNSFFEAAGSLDAFFFASDFFVAFFGLTAFLVTFLETQAFLETQSLFW